MSKQSKSILDEDLGETEQTFHRTSIARKLDPKIAEAFKKAEAKKQKETLPAACEPAAPFSIPDLFFLGEKVGVYSPCKGEFWFCLSDACKVLGFDPEQARKSLLLGEAMTHRPEKATKDRYYISESDLYNLTLRSSKPIATPLRKWVAEKVLPALRKDGRFCMTGEMAEQLASKHGKSLLEPIEGTQLELFPITAKPSLKFQPAAVDALLIARRKLLEKGTVFETYSAFLGYLIKESLDRLGVTGFEPSMDGTK
jgi:hypothetical protein